MAARRWPKLAVSLAPLLLGLGCHTTVLSLLSGALAFTSPDRPAAVTQPDAGFVSIDFGQVTINSTSTLTVDLTSLAGQVTLGAVTARQPDPEFMLPFVAGTVVSATPSPTLLSFAPSSVGAKTAVFTLTDYSPHPATVVIQVTGTGIAGGLVAAPDPLDFGLVELNQIQTASLTITNQSPIPASLVISPLQGPGAGLFALGEPALSALAPGASTTMTATFAPLVVDHDAGASIASFTIAGWPTADPLTVSLTGTAVESWLAVTPLLNFNYVQVHKSFVKPALVTNLSSYTTLHLVAPPPTVTGAEFSLQSFAPVPIAPGQSLPIPVAFSPYAFGPASGSLSLTTDDPLGEHPVVALEGFGGGPEIACLPRLSFEPSLVGVTQTEALLCTNAGSNVQGHLDLTLQFSEGDLHSDNALFKVSLGLPDGGPLLLDAGVSLRAGDSAAIYVTFSPPDAGPVFGRLTVTSNDLNDLDAGTILSGVGLDPGPCTLQVMPTELSFGEVPKGDIGRMQFSLTNVGQDYCVLTGVQLEPTGDSAFSLPVGLPAPQTLSFVGNTGFSDGLPSSVLFEAQFAPTTSKAASMGTVDVTAFDTPSRVIVLTGSSLAGCLSVQPPLFDFGVLGFNPNRGNNGELCISDSALFTATNTCAQPLTVTQISVADGPYVAAQFTLDGGPQFPVVLGPGEQTSFVAGFVPESVGPKVNDVLVSASDLPGTPYLVTLEGDPELTGTRTDTFTVPAPPKKVDLAWILDNDDDQTSIGLLAANLPALIDALNRSQIDYQIAVTSTDTCNETGADQGFFEPCDHCLSTSQSNPIFVTPTSLPDPSSALYDLFLGFGYPDPAQCDQLIGDEHLFDTIADAFAPALLSGHNAGFIRPDAYLAILMANGDDEDDATEEGPNFPPSDYLTSLAQVTNIIEGLKPDPSQVSVSLIYSGDENGGASYLPRMVGQLVQATGGIAINSAASNWQSQLVNLFAYGGSSQAFFTLASTPDDFSAIQVSVNGVPTMAWSLTGNQIFLTGAPPAPGSIVTVTYREGC